jgi:hypothetical protein
MLFLPTVFHPVQSVWAVDNYDESASLGGYNVFVFNIKPASTTVTSVPLIAAGKKKARINIYNEAGSHIANITRTVWVEGKLGTSTASSATIGWATIPIFCRDTITTSTMETSVTQSLLSVTKCMTGSVDVEGFPMIRLVSSGVVDSVSHYIEVGME